MKTLVAVLGALLLVEVALSFPARGQTPGQQRRINADKARQWKMIEEQTSPGKDPPTREEQLAAAKAGKQVKDVRTKRERIVDEYMQLTDDDRKWFRAEIVRRQEREAAAKRRQEARRD